MLSLSRKNRNVMLKQLIAAALVLTQVSTVAYAAPKRKPAAAKPAAAKPMPMPASAGDDEQTKLAKQYFRAAETDFSLGRFEPALDNYSKAYEAKALPAFLFNIGQCHMELHNYERAIFFYEQYLRGDVEARRRALVNKRLEEARIQQAALDAAQEKAAQEQRDREQQELALRAQEQATLAAMQAEAERVNMMNTPPPKPLYKKPLFWVAVVAAAGAITAGVIIATSSSKADLPNGDLATIDLR